MRLIPWLWLVVGGLAALSVGTSRLTHAQTIAPALTYTAHKYLESERLIEKLLSDGLIATLEQQLATDFSAKDVTLKPFDRNGWLKKQQLRARRPWDVRDLNIQSMGDTRVVSFNLVDPQSLRQQRIVDIWSDSEGKLMARFEGLVWTPSTRQSNPPFKTVRPDGKG